LRVHRRGAEREQQAEQQWLNGPGHRDFYIRVVCIVLCATEHALKYSTRFSRHAARGFCCPEVQSARRGRMAVQESGNKGIRRLQRGELA
jgi:hypothetical protein